MRVENINGIKVKVFTKKDLTQKLGFSEEESKIIMQYQKTFPELLQDKVEGFVIDARRLWEQLDKPQGEFGKWIKRKVISRGYVENSDFANIDKSVDIGKTNISRKQSEYFLNVDCAKNVCMSENTDKGRLTRRYFILMEKAIRSMDDWIVIREPQKEGYKELCSKLKEKYEEISNSEVPYYVYSNEADMLNVALLGARAKDIREELEIKDNQTREWLNSEVNKALCELQLIDSSLVIGNIYFEERKRIIEDTCDSKYCGLRNMIFKELEVS